jgi:LPXTG-site transpeptidase (sortase) family protein
MYSRHNRSGCTPQFLVVGTLIVLCAVIAFALFQQFQALRPQAGLLTSTAIVQRATVVPIVPTLTPEASPTPKPHTLSIVADRAQLLTDITELYFGTDDDWDLTHLGQMAGHLEGTPNIGQGGNYVLAGHVEMKDGSPGPFAFIGSLQPGDFISVFSDKPGTPLVMQYAVSAVKIVKPTDFDVIRNHGYEELTLVTCKDWDQKTRTYLERVVVHARPIMKAQVVPPK